MKPTGQLMKRNLWCLALGCLLATSAAYPQTTDENATSAGFIPVLSGTFAYVQNTNGGATSLEPQIETVLLVPFSSHVLLESRAEFTGFFTREFGTHGPYGGKVFKTVDYAQVDWLANTHLIATGGAY